MLRLHIPTAEVFEPLVSEEARLARYLGAWGGRGSGKSHNFAGMAVDRNLTPGTRGVCLREIQKSLTDSAKRLIEDKIKEVGAPGFRVLNDRIETPGNGVIIFKGMRDYTTGRSGAQDIMSLEGFDWAWVEQAETLGKQSLQILRPTIRKPGSQLWFSWNPRRRSDPVDDLLRGANRPASAVVVRANWSDNPWFPAELEAERQHDLKHSPAYQHVWEGQYATIVEGAYYAASLNQAIAEERICRVARDPLQTVRVFCDLGGSGAKADAFTMWVAQFLGREIRVLDYYEAVGQAASAHFDWLRERDYDRAHIWLPHDGTQTHGPVDTTWEGAFKAAGFPKVHVVPNQGKGAARQRIEAGRRFFPMIWFNAATTEAGREALGAYHELKDEHREIGLGPNHDWASHGADAFGLMCIAYEPPRVTRDSARGSVFTVQDEQGLGWLAN